MKDERRPAPPLRVVELVRLYLHHAQDYYKTSRHAANLRSALARFAISLPPTFHAQDIARHHVKSWISDLAAVPLSRTYCNKCLAYVKLMFRWALEEQLLDLDVVHQVLSVQPLKPNRSPAREPEPRNPVELDRVLRTLPHLQQTPRDIILLLALTGARVGELCTLKQSEILDTDNPAAPLIAVPALHKTAHHGKSRTIPFKPEACIILDRYRRPLLFEDFVFCAPRSIEHYKPLSVAQAVRRACKKAGVPLWSPHQVRHTVATIVRDRLSLDAAAALLGHADTRTTARYAKPTIDAAAAAVAALPGLQEARR